MNIKDIQTDLIKNWNNFFSNYYNLGNRNDKENIDGFNDWLKEVLNDNEIEIDNKVELISNTLDITYVGNIWESDRYRFDSVYKNKMDTIHSDISNNLELLKRNTLNNNKNSVFSNTLKKKEKNFMSKNFEYVENVSLTIPENCIGKRKDGSIVYLEKDKDGNNLPIKKVFITLPQRQGEDFRRKFTIPAVCLFQNQIKEFKTISLSKAVNKDTKEEMKFYIQYEKKGQDGMWHDVSKEFSDDKRSVSFNELTSLIKDVFKNLNNKKEVDGKVLPATHYMWLPQNAYENQNDSNKNVPTCKKMDTGDYVITLPQYAKVHSFKTYDYNKDTKEFAEGKEQNMNLNFANIIVKNTYTSNDNNKSGLVGIMLPDDSKISVNIHEHTGKDGQVYEGGRYFINANDLREAIKQDFKDYKKSLNKLNEHDVSEIKKDVESKDSQVKETNERTNENSLEK